MVNLSAELQRARDTIEELRAKVSAAATASKRCEEREAPPTTANTVTVTVSDVTMNSPSSERRRRKKPQKEEPVPEPLHRSASWADVHAGEGAESGGLPDAVSAPGKPFCPGGEKMSITDMVAESLKNPSCIATIRRELKADALTPKIQRKFHMKTTPTSLPSMNDSSSSLEASPLAKENVKGMATKARNMAPGANT